MRKFLSLALIAALGLTVMTGCNKVDAPVEDEVEVNEAEVEENEADVEENEADVEENEAEVEENEAEVNDAE